MRITRDTLLKLAQDSVSQRTRYNRGIIAIFATGSLLESEPLLGGATDIDLFVIHDSEPAFPREIVQISPEIHLDIAHHAQALYRQPRHLRCDPWLGSTVYNNPILLHDTQHWFEFTQASARSQFWLAANVIARARPLAENARQVWLGLQTSTAEPAERVNLFLQALESAANAIACLSGSPLTERRFLTGFPDRAKAANNPGLSHGLLGLLGGNQVEAAEIQAWMPGWRLAFQSAGSNPDAPLRLHPHRQVYYERAIDFYLSSDQPQHCLWPLLQTWTSAVTHLPSHLDIKNDWLSTCDRLGLGESGMGERLAGLDQFLDGIEETLETWAFENGA